MKYFKILLLCVLFSNCKSNKIVNITEYQKTAKSSNIYFKDLDDNYSNYIGTWESTNSNITFRLILWKTSRVKVNLSDGAHFLDILDGRFQMIKNLGQIDEVVLHSSVKTYPQNGTTSNSILTAFSIDQNLCMGTFTDNCANGGSGIIEGGCGLRKLTSTTIRFTLKKIGRLSPGETFTVPTDAVLTKVKLTQTLY